jgi:hypothetical protein
VRTFAHMFSLREPMKAVYDDGGREAAGFKASKDCVVRAIALVMERDYAEIYHIMEQRNHKWLQTTRQRWIRMMRKRDPKKVLKMAHPKTGTYKESYHDWILDQGYEWVPTMKIGSGCTVHLAAGELPMGRLIVVVSRHLTAVIDGVVHDTHDCTRRGTRCVYGYYVKRPPAQP